MRKCLGKHSCMSSPFSIAMLNHSAWIYTLLYIDQCTNTLLWWCACYQITKLQTKQTVTAEVQKGYFEKDGCEWLTELVFLCPLYLFPYLFSSSYLLPLFHWLISRLLFASVRLFGNWENIFVWSPNFLYHTAHTEWNFFSSLYGKLPNGHWSTPLVS